MFALGAAGSNDEAKYLKLGGDLANTCHEAYIRSGTPSYSTFTFPLILSVKISVTSEYSSSLLSQ